MAYLLQKICLVLLVASFAVAQIANPDSTWSEYKVKACCPVGYNEVGNYCVKCKAPLFFDAVSGKCNSCPTGHFYNAQTFRCECEVPCPAPRAINATTKQCECPLDEKKVRLVYNPAGQNGGSCDCPQNLPLWNGKYCVVCPTGTTYDPKERQCYYCPDGFVRDANTHSCVPGL